MSTKKMSTIEALLLNPKYKGGEKNYEVKTEKLISTNEISDTVEYGKDEKGKASMANKLLDRLNQESLQKDKTNHPAVLSGTTLKKLNQIKNYTGHNNKTIIAAALDFFISKHLKEIGELREKFLEENNI